jgi:hypothetical protein
MPLPSYIAPRAVIFENFERPEVRALLDDIASRPGFGKFSRSYLALLKQGGSVEYWTQITKKRLGFWNLPPDFVEQGRDAALDLAKRAIGLPNAP